MTRDFYARRIFPLGFLMARARRMPPLHTLRCRAARRPQAADVASLLPRAQAATLGFGNLAYLYLSVSFIQILKAATPVMTMVILVAVRLDKLSTPVRRSRAVALRRSSAAASRSASCTPGVRCGVHHCRWHRHRLLGRARLLHGRLPDHDHFRCVDCFSTLARVSRSRPARRVCAPQSSARRASWRRCSTCWAI